jgi:hypothetical protein
MGVGVHLKGDLLNREGVGHVDREIAYLTLP